jgi:hypothetical protein
MAAAASLAASSLISLRTSRSSSTKSTARRGPPTIDALGCPRSGIHPAHPGLRSVSYSQSPGSRPSFLHCFRMHALARWPRD